MTAEVFSITADRPEQKTVPLMTVARESEVKNTGMREQNLLSLSYGEIVPKDINSTDGLLPASFETYQIVEPGMTVLRFTDLQNDQRSLRSGLVKERGIITSAYVAVDPFGMDSRFFAYLMRAYDTNKVFYSMGGGVRQSMKFESIRRLPVPVLTAGTQHAIADYLDHETAQIDVLVAKQQEFIGLLKERRRALADEEFQRSDGKRRATVRQALVPVQRTPQPGSGVVTAYRDGVVTLRTNRRVEGYTMSAAEAGYQGVVPGDIVFHGLDGFAGAVGISDSMGRCSPVYHVCLPRYDDDAEYLALLIRYLGTSGYLSTQAPSTRQRSVDFRNWGTFARVPLMLPEVDHQKAFVVEFRERTARIDALIAKAEKHILLATERRHALITAAVTGQIDVGTATRKVG